MKPIKFYIGNEKIEKVEEMIYSGNCVNNNITFNSAIDNLESKWIKTLFKLFKSFGKFSRIIKTAAHLFGAMIKPILLYI